MFEEMVIRKIGIMNRWLQQKIGFTNFAQIVKVGTDPILDWYISNVHTLQAYKIIYRAQMYLKNIYSTPLIILGTKTCS